MYSYKHSGSGAHDYRSPSSVQFGLQEVGYSINKGLSQSMEYLAGLGTECVEQ